MIRNVADDLYQISEYVSGKFGSEAVSVYVLLNGERPVLIDCGSHLHRESIMADLDSVLNGRTPSHIFLTHSELPHAGNISSVVGRWPEIHCVVSDVMLAYIEVLPALPLSQITQATAGSAVTVGGRTLDFVTALLKDQPGSQWIYDGETGTLFSGDGFGYHCPPEQSGRFSDEIPGGIQTEQFESYHRQTFRFLRWIRPERFNADLDRLFGLRPISIVAPIHGAAIRGDIALHQERIKDAITAVCDGYRALPREAVQ
jgi:flavorubredoxin